jgi:hypothetical protein
MPSDWRRWTLGKEFKVEDDVIVVALGDGRSQRVVVEETEAGDSVRLWSVAVRPSALSEQDDPHLFAWDRNRSSDLVGFKVDGRARLIGEAWVPTVGLEAAEWVTYVRAVAVACDRIEYLLTGRDEG